MKKKAFLVLWWKIFFLSFSTPFSSFFFFSQCSLNNLFLFNTCSESSLHKNTARHSLHYVASDCFHFQYLTSWLHFLCSALFSNDETRSESRAHDNRKLFFSSFYLFVFSVDPSFAPCFACLNVTRNLFNFYPPICNLQAESCSLSIPGVLLTILTPFLFRSSFCPAALWNESLWCWTNCGA